MSPEVPGVAVNVMALGVFAAVVTLWAIATGGGGTVTVNEPVEEA